MATKDTAAKTDTDSKTEENITDDKTEAADTSKKKKAALAKAKQVLKIGFVSFSEEDQRHKDLKLGMEKRMQDEGYEAEMIVRETPMYANAQLEAIDEVVKAGIKGLLLTPYNDKRIVEKIDELEAKGIPVVTVCSDIEGTKRTAYVGSDNKRLGQTVGALLGLMSGGHAEVGIITGSRDVLGQEQRIAGFTEKIRKEYPGITIETIAECKNEDYKCYDTLQRIAVEFPTLTSFIFTAGGVGGGCKALYQMTARPNYHIITIDEIAATVEYMNKGIITAAICQEPKRQGRKAITILIDAINKKKPENEFTYTDINIRIKENI
ncbi:MAG: substrate-binding domain-containing protein [Lachnospiraceae bacterium]|nr:substrate-binding domain-containing protein [Lachnospiraceae bacterium]